jgi:predicted nucleic acid-binding protein
MKWLLDTNVVVDHLDGRLAAPLPDGELHYSVITELECLSRPSLDEAGILTVRAFLSTMTMTELSEPIRAAAVAIRRSRAVRLPDAIILATAQVIGATLLTNDEQLLGVSGIPSAPLARLP